MARTGSASTHPIPCTVHPNTPEQNDPIWSVENSVVSDTIRGLLIFIPESVTRLGNNLTRDGGCYSLLCATPRGGERNEQEHWDNDTTGASKTIHEPGIPHRIQGRRVETTLCSGKTDSLRRLRADLRS